MDERILKLERQVRLLSIYGSLVTGILLLLVLTALTAQRADDQIIRAKALIIEDEAGRERILLGAPIPFASNRVRTNLERVRQIWGPRFPKEYMEFYKEYRHEMSGLLVLDEQGFDRVAIGHPVPDPNIGKRIAPATGISINDEQGFERTGYGLLKVNDRYRVVLGLDDAKGREGLVLSLHDDGRAGLTVRDGDRSLYLGTAPPADAVTALSEPFHGLLLKQAGEIRHKINAATAH